MPHAPATTARKLSYILPRSKDARGPRRLPPSGQCFHDPHGRRLRVRFGRAASAPPRKLYPRDLPRPQPRSGRLRGITGLPHRNRQRPSFNDLVSDREHAWRNDETECFGGLQVDHELEFGRLHDR